MDGAELCAFINRMLTKACNVEPPDVVGGARDSCSTNGTAMRNLKLVMLNLQDFLCVSHTLSKLGEHIDMPTLEGFMTHWLGQTPTIRQDSLEGADGRICDDRPLNNPLVLA